MKIRRVSLNNRKRQLEFETYSNRRLPIPYSRLDPRPDRGNPIRQAFVDRELGREAVTYILESGTEGSIHIEQVLDYNEDPTYLGELLLYNLTREALSRIDECGLSRREISRRLGTSAPQLYRLLDPTNTRKSLNQLVSLLQILGCDVDLVVRDVTT
jgi:hypothetical protein